MTLEMKMDEKYEQGREKGLEEGLEQGLEQGYDKCLCDLIRIKLAKGRTVLQIADEFEKSEEVIQKLIKENGLER